MATYPAPTEILSTFNSVVFDTNNVPLTIAEGEKYFLKYPVAQGAETISTLSTGTLSVSGNFITPSVRIGSTLIASKPLLSCIMIQNSAALTSSGGVYSSFSSNNGGLVGTFQFPVNVTLRFITAHSSQSTQTTATNVSLLFGGGFSYTSASWIATSGASPDSYTLAEISQDINANTSFNCQMVTSAASVNAKNFNVFLYYSQRV